MKNKANPLLFIEEKIKTHHFLPLAQEIILADKYAATLLHMPTNERFLLSLLGGEKCCFSIDIIQQPAHQWLVFKDWLRQTIANANFLFTNYSKNYFALKRTLNDTAKIYQKYYLRRFVGYISEDLNLCKYDFAVIKKISREFLYELELGRAQLNNLSVSLDKWMKYFRTSVEHELSELKLVEKNIIALEKQLVKWSNQLQDAAIGISMGALEILTGDFFGFFLMAASIIWIGVISSRIVTINQELEDNKHKKITLFNEINVNNHLLSFLSYLHLKLETLLSQGRSLVDEFTLLQHKFLGLITELDKTQESLKDLSADSEGAIEYIMGDLETLNEEFLLMEEGFSQLHTSLNVPIQMENQLWTPNALSFAYMKLNQRL